MFRALALLAFWGVAALPVAFIGFPWTFISGNVDLLYRMATGIALFGVRLVGVKVEVVGLDKLDWRRTYIFMCNHVSNLDPPIVIPVIPRRTSVLVKKELFRVPILGPAMRKASLVQVDRRNRESAIASLRLAAEVLRSGVNMTIWPEGTRSPDGRLLPFKKGPFHLAKESGVPIVPITLVGTHEIWPKGEFAIHPGTATVLFHEPLNPAAYPSQEDLIKAVRDRMRGGLPEKYQ
ncbi:MAG TPA: lysophospholipid acyltransferase family protein [Terriglobales bacterium]|nr:lysophospholipid acyltransferase family protein [Terriglobales bacterium]